MYGVPKDINLTSMIGTRLDSITFAEFTIGLAFDDGHRFSVFGQMKFRNQKGKELEEGTPTEIRQETQLSSLVGDRVKGIEMNPPTSITIVFSSARSIELIDAGSPYEAFSVEPEGIVV